ncbi:GNAT family N-acetyltransferase [Amycolatopsis sp. H20-H5]|uniref:GNAT family N-acetyltransferase n=1 Tax=Amycolatopsis sp. H20-H5 TaxID=3046309 RepID=UPI002DB6D11E|nr:GNAT family N-acetyltransferase [Amycolatopsis sp. H20-H5]MEC3979968.1 GNAT family N-acetyltransferase [Amycolatopsis sp. H20-H5]
MSEIEIRGTRPGDGPGCALVWQDLGRFFAGINPDTYRVPGSEGLADWFETLNAKLRDDDQWLQLVAVADGEIAGQLAATLQQPMAAAERQIQADFSRRRLVINALGVRDADRRGGVGTALMLAAEQWGRTQGAEVVLLDTELNNHTSMPFYEQRMGFTARAVQFRKELG